MEIRRTGNASAIKKVLEELGRKEIKVGFFESAKYPDGTPIAYVAAIQEFGHGPIPPRPFMRPAEQQNAAKWQKGIAAGVKSALNGSITIEHALEQVGMVAAGDVRKAIKAVTAPPLADSTISARQRRLKGKKAASIKPLVDSGQMIQAVTSAVVDK
ncbi:MAG: hypothetical protein J6D44_04585 [Pseudomonas sp.]|nr:hypothetical protein [Pseudomonas sp.]